MFVNFRGGKLYESGVSDKLRKKRNERQRPARGIQQWYTESTSLEIDVSYLQSKKESRVRCDTSAGWITKTSIKIFWINKIEATRTKREKRSGRREAAESNWKAWITGSFMVKDCTDVSPSQLKMNGKNRVLVQIGLLCEGQCLLLRKLLQNRAWGRSHCLRIILQNKFCHIFWAKIEKEVRNFVNATFTLDAKLDLQVAYVVRCLVENENREGHQ